ncbi:MAG: hypothetical protein PHU85_00205 [Phycisphaerae bacterium]|nr:hypothetical protein [Phycisphaerae bacterium]
MSLEENAAAPVRVAVDGNVVEQHSLREQIEYDQYVAKKAAAASTATGLPIRIGRIRPGGTV